MDSDARQDTPGGTEGVPDGFREQLFARVPAEDVSDDDADGLARIVATAFRHLGRPRLPGSHTVSLSDAEIAVGGRERELTILDVVNDDKPFLLDSVLAALVEAGLEPLLVAHPILPVFRDPDGAFGSLGEGGRPESLIHVHLDRLDPGEARAALAATLTGICDDVGSVARDAAAMRDQLAGLEGEYAAGRVPTETDEREEAAAFLRWLADGHFVLMGMRAARVPEGDGAPEPLPGSGLGLLADPTRPLLKREGALVAITPEIRAFLHGPEALIVTKASIRSSVASRSYLDYIGAKVFAASGKLWGELAIVGLFTPAAYTEPAGRTPLLRRKVAAVQAQAGFDPDSFDGRALRDVLEGFPRDELFQIDEDTLYGFALDVLRLREHPRVRVLLRADRFGRFVSCLVYLPRDRDGPGTGAAVAAYLAAQLGGRVSALYPPRADGPLSRTHVIIGRDAAEPPAIDRAAIEAGVADIARTWADRLGVISDFPIDFVGCQFD